MAASNYSDVVQALAKQIVDVCMQTLRKNIQGLVAGVTISADQIDGEITNVSSSAMQISADNVIGINEYVASMISNAKIDVTQVATIGPDGKLYLNEVNINSAQIEDLEAKYAVLWEAQIGRAEIQDLIANMLEANIARIADAEIGRATIDAAQITALEAVSAEIANLLVKNANIDYAQIRDLIADKAIIEKGVNGKLYVADLAVTDANVVSLTAGELVVKGKDGGFYSVTVDDSGQVTAVPKTVKTSDIDNLAITGDKIADYAIDGDLKIIENSITARTLNVQDIFANNAMIANLIAKHIDASELFANQAFINHLNTADISSNTSLRLAIEQMADDIMGEVSILLEKDRIISMVTGSYEFSRIIDERTRQTVTSYYAVSDSGTEPPGDDADWQTEIPEAAGGEYVWTKVVTEYANGGAPSIVYHVTQFGAYGADGITVKITSDGGFTYKTPSGTLTLTADVYAGGTQLDQADVNVLGGIQWFKDGERVLPVTNWHQLAVDLATVGEKAVFTAALMG